MDLDNLIAKFSNSTENQSKAIFSTLFIAGNKLQTFQRKQNGAPFGAPPVLIRSRSQYLQPQERFRIIPYWRA